MTEDDKKLQAELDARRKQYEADDEKLAKFKDIMGVFETPEREKVLRTFLGVFEDLGYAFGLQLAEKDAEIKRLKNILRLEATNRWQIDHNGDLKIISCERCTNQRRALEALWGLATTAIYGTDYINPDDFEAKYNTLDEFLDKLKEADDD